MSSHLVVGFDTVDVLFLLGSGGFGVVHIADRYLAKSDGIRKDPTWPECAVKVLTMPTGSGQRFKEMSDRIR